MDSLRSRTWTDEHLKNAVEASSSWRGVLRTLGLNGTSASAIRLVRQHVMRLELDVSHFRGRRRWSDTQLKHAVAESQSWDRSRSPRILPICAKRGRPSPLPGSLSADGLLKAPLGEERPAAGRESA